MLGSLLLVKLCQMHCCLANKHSWFRGWWVEFVLEWLAVSCHCLES